jgi:hypothetical protein
VVDLVISVGTSVAHLNSWPADLVLSPFVPDWRWLRDREDSPWYPSVRLSVKRAKVIGTI